ncbi:hypothetical protein V8B97DRAFT_1914143 [Scleroderma yunnanense]
MLLNSLVAVAAFGLAASAQVECPTIPLCCDQVIYGPTTSVTSTIDSLGIVSPPGGIYPVGLDCVPIENPPADYILLCTSPRIEVCCKENNWGKRTPTSWYYQWFDSPQVARLPLDAHRYSIPELQLAGRVYTTLLMFQSLAGTKWIHDEEWSTVAAFSYIRTWDKKRSPNLLDENILAFDIMIP